MGKFEKKAEKLYFKSLELLEEFQLDNGAILASSPKGRYPYVYPRDHAVCCLALINADKKERAKKALNFILRSQTKDGSFPQRVDKKGKDKSYKPIQLDNTGLILFAIAKYIRSFGSDDILNKTNKERIDKAVKYIMSNLDEDRNLFLTPNSIHEFPPLEKGLEIWANSTCFGALKELKELKVVSISKLKLKNIRDNLECRFWNGSHFIKNIRVGDSSSIDNSIDASEYSIADFEVLTDENKKVKKTVDIIEKELWHKGLGGICRYKKRIGRNNGGWGPWPHFTLMIARHHIRRGNKKRAKKYLKWILNISYNDKLPEHVACREEFDRWVTDYRRAGILRKDREKMIENIRDSKLYGEKNFAYSVLPLAWPHAEFVRTWNLYKQRFLK